MGISLPNSKFRLGLVGAGRMGRTHLRALIESQVVQITDIADPVSQARDTLTRAGYKTHSTVDSLLSEGCVDGLLIAAPTGKHLELIRAAAKVKMPVLCEKPAGLTSNEVREAGRLASDSNIVFQVAYWRRFIPELITLREKIQSGLLGDIHLLIAFQWDESPPSEAFRAGSGGIFTDMGVHEFDMIRWLTGQDITDIKSVGAAPGCPAGSSTDWDSAQALISLSNGSSAIVSLGRYFPGGDMVGVEAFGTTHHYRIPVIDPKDGEGNMLAALRSQAEAFAAYVTTGRPTGASVEDALSALSAAEQAAKKIEL
ncbi:Gfo/Idh/MocA family protein [Streptomyces sp. NPDC060085]|uniref:Gfo/Idh/MocA family protein n=1 Tax=Streptomyces sp. NPDC060085 TaxID=3347054 RepID=UPI0036613ACB